MAVSAVVVSLAGEKGPASPAEPLQLLQEKVAKLEARVAALEKQQPSVVLRADSPTPSEPLPKGWQKREFNGTSYYVVPLRGDETSAPSTEPLRGPTTPAPLR